MRMSLKVDLSEEQMKNSEKMNVPLSRRPGQMNAIAKEQGCTIDSDLSVSKHRFGACMKRGNFRRT